MQRVVLIGDSILDNASYTAGGPAVIDHLRRLLTATWDTDLLEVDGAATGDAPHQLRHLTAQHKHLVFSVRGDDALLRSDFSETAGQSSGDALLLLAGAPDEIERSYRTEVTACLGTKLPLVICPSNEATSRSQATHEPSELHYSPSTTS